MNPNQKSCLVGFSGFVGGNLKAQSNYDLLINSKNQSEVLNKHFSYFVFCGARAEKWKANLNPDADLVHLSEITEMLKTVNADRAVLISTVDVFAETTSIDETDYPSLKNTPYGLNRARLEQFFKNHFENSHIIRLPALFGPGLKKNIIYDFLNNNETEKIDSRSKFQFYDLKNLSHDISQMIAENIQTLHLATEPIAAAEIGHFITDKPFHNEITQNFPQYDFKSIHSASWGGNNGYLYSKNQILKALKKFVAAYKKERSL